MRLVGAFGYLIGLTVIGFLVMFGVPFAIWVIAVSL